MRLFIAEKPSLAKAIAANLGSSASSGDGCIKLANGDVVTWCFGHMLENAAPDEYDKKWEKWDTKTLPILVENWILKPKKTVTKQLKIIKELLRLADVVINAGDPDREGQLLVDEVLDYYEWRGKTLRLLLNATDSASVKSALSSMRDNKEFKNLSSAALCRSRADWLVGMNLSRAATKIYGRDQVISIGRVQTPTLALVVRRDREIENFKPQTFYNLAANVTTAVGPAKLVHEPKENRILDPKTAQALAQEMQGKDFPLTVTQKKARNTAPMPYMLATFQKDAEDLLGLGAKQALEVLQELYEAQATSYPRTDHERLPPEQSASATKIAATVISFGFAKEAEKLQSLMQPSKRIYSLPKEAEHHGIIPTGKEPTKALSAPQKRAYELICRRFVATLLPDYEFEETVVTLTHKDRVFSQTGEIPLNMDKSWRVLEPKKNLRTLTLTGKPANGVVQDVEINQGKTTPPKRYTEATLIADMRSVAKFVTDPKLKSRLKETSGIGTAATQASVIETLKLRKFIQAEKKGSKSLISTEFGRLVIDKSPKPLSDPGVTAAWEDALSLVADGKYSASDFMQRAEIFVKNQLDRILGKS